MKEFFLIINPVAAGGRVETIWKDQIKPLVDNCGLLYDFEFTTAHSLSQEAAISLPGNARGPRGI